MTTQVVLFGATGFTGRLVTRALMAQGISPVLVGRDRTRLEQQAKNTGGLPFDVADATDSSTLARLLSPGDILITTVGPFCRYGDAALQAAIDAECHYIDSTGEPDFIAKVFGMAGTKIPDEGPLALTAFGYDYVPGNCAAAVALEEAGQAATAVDIGYFLEPPGIPQLSQGTFASLCDALVQDVVYYNDASYRKGAFGQYFAKFDVNGRKASALSAPGSEVHALPRVYPWLRDVNGYNGWFGPLCRFFSLFMRLHSIPMKFGPYRYLMRTLTSKIGSGGRGPDEEKRDASGSRIVAVAKSAQGAVLARADLVGDDGYDYTARMIAWAAASILQNRHLRGGVCGPVDAFGLEPLLAGQHECGLELQSSNKRTLRPVKQDRVSAAQ